MAAKKSTLFQTSPLALASANSKTPKIVYWDLETLPDPRVIYSNIPSIGAWPGRTFKAELQSIMSFGYKIEGDKKASCINAWEFDNWDKDRHDDSALVQIIYDTLYDADEIVTHNGKSFDLKVLNTRLMKFGMPPLPPLIKHVDTRIVLKNKLSLYSNSLDKAAKFFGLDKKIHWADKWDTWTRFAFKEESKKDRKQMDKYCKMDVEVLQQLYKKTRPLHGSSGVNHAQMDGRSVCPKCGENKLIKHGKSRTTTMLYQRYLCTACGSTSRTDVNDKNQRCI